MLFDERQTLCATEEDLEQNITDILMVMQRHVFVIQRHRERWMSHCFSTETRTVDEVGRPTARLTQETVELPKPQFINKVVDVRVTTQRQIPQSKWR